MELALVGPELARGLEDSFALKTGSWSNRDVAGEKLEQTGRVALVQARRFFHASGLHAKNRICAGDAVRGRAVQAGGQDNRTGADERRAARGTRRVDRDGGRASGRRDRVGVREPARVWLERESIGLPA